MKGTDPGVNTQEGLRVTLQTKPLSWQRNIRITCDICKQMKACSPTSEVLTITRLMYMSADSVRWKQIKCNRNGDESCARCISRRLQCVTTPVEKKKRRATNKRDAAFDESEARIKRMESAIIISGQTGTLEVTKEHDHEQKPFDQIESQAELSDRFANLIVDSDGCPNFIGWASGFSLFSSKGLRWISDKLGSEDELAGLGRELSKHDRGVWGRADHELWYPLPRSQHCPLPPKSVALQVVKCYFFTSNSVLPVVNERVFNAYLEQQYSSNPPSSTSWYALFNAVLCIGSIRMPAEHAQDDRTRRLIDYTSVSEETGVGYFRNASYCFHDLLFKDADLMAMQAMTLMLFITTTSPNPQPSYVLASAAGTLANTLGLHRDLNGPGRAPEEIEQRRNVFWVFYIMEESISQNLGRPSIINDNDIAVKLPPKKTKRILSPSGVKIYDIFQDHVTLAVIRSRIYNELYSAESQTRPAMDRLKILGKLDTHLQAWRDAIPLEIRPEYSITCSEEQYAAVIMMHFTYLDAVIMLHRLIGRQTPFNSGEGTDLVSHGKSQQLNPRIFASELLCLAAARRSIQLLHTFSNEQLQKQHINWKAIYYPLSASLILFTNILSNPKSQHAATDLHLMNLVTLSINQFVQPGSSFADTPTLNAFKELVNISTRFLARFSEPLYQQKRVIEGESPQTAFVSSSEAGPADAGFSFDRWDESSRPISTRNILMTADAETNMLISNHSSAHSDLHMSPDTGLTGTEASPSSANFEQLDFAPFLPLDFNQTDVSQSDSFDFPFQMGYDMDLDGIWPSFTSDPWAVADLPADSCGDVRQDGLDDIGNDVSQPSFLNQ